MDEPTKIKYAYTLILLGTITAILCILVLSTGLTAINKVFQDTTSQLWTNKQTALITFISIATLITSILTYKIGTGTLAQGFKLLRSIEADQKLKELLERVKKNATKDKNNNT